MIMSIEELLTQNKNFIYKIASPEDAQKGMSKRLRGRSLYLTLLGESIVSYIIEEWTIW